MLRHVGCCTMLFSSLVQMRLHARLLILMPVLCRMYLESGRLIAVLRLSRSWSVMRSCGFYCSYASFYDLLCC